MSANQPNEPGPPPTDSREPAAPDAGGLQPLPLDLTSPQFTLRAVLTGMVLAAVLSICNVYIGLQLGFALNMSLVAVLLGYAFWAGVRGVSGGRVRPWGILENNINQTACSSGALVASAGLVAPIPALAMMTGTTLTWHYLALWVFAVCLVGILVAIALRRQMVIASKLPFPVGTATAEMLRELHARGREALARVIALGSGAVVAVAAALLISIYRIGPRGVPLSIWGFKSKALTFGALPSPYLYGIGGLIGFRACASLLLGSILAYGVIAPPLIRSGHLWLTVREPLPVLPAGVELDPQTQPNVRYNQRDHQLEWKGIMSVAQQRELLARSGDPRYREAVHKLYLRSQRELIVPLGESPAKEFLAQLPVEYDAKKQALRCTGGIERGTAERLRQHGAPLRFVEAVARLAEYFDYTTTRELHISEELETLPKGLIIPREYAGTIRHDEARGRLVAIGPVSSACCDELLHRADELTQQHPEQVPLLATFRGALGKLYERSSRSFLPAGVAIPEELAGVVTYDDTTKTLRARGVLGATEAQTLRRVSEDADYRSAVSDLISGTRFVGAAPNYGDMLQWLVWPGVTLMVVASLVSFAFSWRSVLAAIPRWGRKRQTATPDRTGDVPVRWFVGGLIAALILSVVLQVSFFQIVWWAAVVGVLLAFVLAIVAARVSGETGMTPVGQMGKVAQLSLGALSPQSPAANLMAANVAGGAASQAADLLHDLKCGHLLGTVPRLQALAQICGALVGALVGSAVYLLMITDPQTQLMTAEWPAPAVATLKTVAELFQVGFHLIPPGTVYAMLIAAGVGVLLPILEKTLPRKVGVFVPSAASIGLAFVIPAWQAIPIFLGGLAALCLGKWCKSWTQRFLVAICAGLVAGESLTDVGIVLWGVIAS